MKTPASLIIILIGVMVFQMSYSAWSQAPQSFKYQAVARDKSGQVLPDQNISLRISILQNTTNGPEIYREIHSVTTSELGLINIEVGHGKAPTGSLSSIEWSTGSHFLRVEMDQAGGTDFELMGVSQLLSVPYALYAEKAGSGKREADLDWEILGNDLVTGHGGSYPKGNVGIGNNAPGSLLYVAKSTAEPTITVRNMGGGGGATYSMIDDLSGANWKFKATTFGGFKIRDQANALDVFTIEPNSAANALYIDSPGNIGIGISDPQERLDVKGKIKAQALIITDANGRKWQIGVDTLGSLTVFSVFENCGDSLCDERDGKYYQTVLIGTQCWMAENLNVGMMINSNTGGQLQTDNGVIEKYCYNNNAANCNIYGGLYEWKEAMQYVTSEGTQGICPEGWHFPTDNEWKILEGTVDSQYPVGDPEWDLAGTIRGSDAGGNLKEAGTTHWNSPNTGATNSSGFTALPGGDRSNGSGNFYDLNNKSYFWSSSQSPASFVWTRGLQNSHQYIYRGDYYKEIGFSVRCLKDD